MEVYLDWDVIWKSNEEAEAISRVCAHCGWFHLILSDTVIYSELPWKLWIHTWCIQKARPTASSKHLNFTTHILAFWLRTLKTYWTLGNGIWLGSKHKLSTCRQVLNKKIGSLDLWSRKKSDSEKSVSVSLQLSRLLCHIHYTGKISSCFHWKCYFSLNFSTW